MRAVKKGVVLKRMGKYATVLEKGGRFVRVPAKKGWAVGDVVTLSRQPGGHSISFWAIQAAGMLLILLTLQYGYYHYNKVPATYVSVDINPSVEIAVNRVDKVISATACNEDGNRVLQGLELEGMNYTNALQHMMDSEAMQQYLHNDPVVMVCISSSSGRESELMAGLNGLYQQVAELEKEVQFRFNVVEWDLTDKAHEIGTTAGRLALFNEMEDASEALTMEEFLEQPISELLNS